MQIALLPEQLPEVGGCPDPERTKGGDVISSPPYARTRTAGPRNHSACRATGPVQVRIEIEAYDSAQKPSSAAPSGLSRSFSNARLRIWRMRSRVTPSMLPISCSVRSSPSSSP